MKWSIVTLVTIASTLPNSIIATQGVAGTTTLNGQTFKWTHTASLPSKMVVNWIASDPEYVTIEMKGPTNGYISIGFSPSGGMSGGDIFLGWVDSSGTPHLLDMFATKNGQPTIDKEQNLELIGGKEDENGTSIIFHRKWDTCDDEDFPIGDDTMRMIWAIGPEDPGPFRGTDKVPLYHGRNVLKRGVRSVFMKVRPNHRKFPDQEETYPPNVQHVDLTVKDVVVPKAETYYHCKIVKFPKLSSKHHIIANRPVIADESLPHIHHIAVFKCHVPEILGKSAAEIFEKYLNQYGGDCYTEEAPHEWAEYCFEFRAAIGIGSEGDIYPDHLGDVIGDSDEASYYRIEVHYENPTGKKLIDSSGIRLFYTPILRQYEMAILFAGHRRTPFLTIPPHQKEYKISSFCGSECTQNGLGKDGIKIISVLLHAHLTGRKIILRHIRNGVELPPIAQDDHVDFNYQHYNEEVTVLPGDELITECTYDTEKNDTFVYGGLSSRREMCESFIVYYPKATLNDCRSQPEFYSYFNAIGVANAKGKLLDSLHLPFNSSELPRKLKDAALADDAMILENGRSDYVPNDLFRNVIITRPKNLEGFDVHDYMTNLNWDDKEFAKSVEEKRSSSLHYMHCSAKGGKKIHTSRDAYPFPVYKPLEIKKRQCGLGMGTSSSSRVLPVAILVSVLVLTTFTQYKVLN